MTDYVDLMPEMHYFVFRVYVLVAVMFGQKQTLMNWVIYQKKNIFKDENVLNFAILGKINITTHLSEGYKLNKM